jgi:hypothetical protein
VNVFFDVDQTIVDSDHRLRPGVRELFERLCVDGHAIYLWSGIGVRWEVVRSHGLEAFVRGCFDKPLYQHARMLDPLGVTVHPDFVVDDHPHPVAAFGGCVVSPYTGGGAPDGEMKRVLGEVRRAAAHGPRAATAPAP